MPPVPPPTRWPVAASTAVRALLDGPARPARVVGVGPTAVYLLVGDRQVVAMEAADGLRLPCAAVVPRARAQEPFRRVRPGDEGRVGGGGLVAGPLAAEVGRWWRPRRARSLPPSGLLSPGAQQLAAMTPALPTTYDEPLGRLVRALVDRGPEDVEQAARDLVGRGEGLTPLGDDVLAGLLLTLSAAPDGPVALLAAPVGRLAPLRTTALSAALLRHAADGQAIPLLVDVVDALAGHGDLTRALLRLLAVGHSSGAGLAQGVLAATHVLLSQTPSRSEVA